MRKAKSNRSCCAGQALIEFALALPLLLWLIINVVNFGGLLHAWVNVSNAARAGVQYMMMGGATVKSPIPATAAQIRALVYADLTTLRNGSSAVVNICINNNGTKVPSGCAFLPAADPEPTLYCVGGVDVTYTYTPYISGWLLPTLGTTTVHRRASQRLAGGCVI